MTSRSKVTLTFAGEDKQLQKTFDNVEKRSDRLKNNFKQFGKVAGAAGTAFGGLAVAGGKALFELGQNFDKAYDQIITGTGATGKALDGLKGSFKNVLATGPDSFDAVATSIADLNTATGLTGKPLEELSRQILDLSRVTGTDLSGNIKSSTRLFGDWGIAVEDQSEALDKLFVVGQQTGATLTEISDLAVKAGAPFRQLGFTFEETISLIGKWNKEGVNTEIVISGMRQAISRWAREGKNLPSTFADVIKSIEDTGSASEATAIAIEAFGAEAGPDLAAAIREGRFGVEDMLEILEDAEGQIGRTADQTASFGEKWAEFKNKLAVGLEPAATKVFEQIGDWLDEYGPLLETEVIPAFGRFFDEIESFGRETQFFLGRLDQIRRFIEQDVVPAFSSMASAVDQWKGNVDRDVQSVEGFFGRWKSNISRDLELVGNFFTRWGQGISRDVNWLGSQWSATTGNMSVAWRTFIGMLGGTAGAIGRALAGVAAAIARPFRDGYYQAVEWANKIPGINIKGPTVTLSGVASNLRAGRSRSTGSISRSRSTGSVRRSTRVPSRVRHAGGVVPGPIGRETPILAKSGEHVVTANRMAAINNMGRSGNQPNVIRIESGGSRMDDVLVELLRKAITNRGGGVEAVLG